MMLSRQSLPGKCFHSLAFLVLLFGIAGSAASDEPRAAKSLPPLKDVLDWARPQQLPIVVVPGGEHFFHGRLNLLAQIVVRYCK